MKDDPGNYGVFTEQGASASHMTAAKVHPKGASGVPTPRKK